MPRAKIIVLSDCENWNYAPTFSLADSKLDIISGCDQVTFDDIRILKAGIMHLTEELRKKGIIRYNDTLHVIHDIQLEMSECLSMIRENDEKLRVEAERLAEQRKEKMKRIELQHAARLEKQQLAAEAKKRTKELRLLETLRKKFEGEVPSLLDGELDAWKAA